MENRVIKFRAWHTEAEKMLFVGDDHGTTHPLDCANYARQGQPVILMQFTGLHDKNGKEIYEGDIVQSHTDKPMVIKWSNRFASFCLARDGWAFQHCFGEACDPGDVEVIGNIYEGGGAFQ